MLPSSHSCARSEACEPLDVSHCLSSRQTFYERSQGLLNPTDPSIAARPIIDSNIVKCIQQSIELHEADHQRCRSFAKAVRASRATGHGAVDHRGDGDDSRQRSCTISRILADVTADVSRAVVVSIPRNVTPPFGMTSMATFRPNSMKQDWHIDNRELAAILFNALPNLSCALFTKKKVPVDMTAHIEERNVRDRKQNVAEWTIISGVQTKLPAAHQPYMLRGRTDLVGEAAVQTPSDMLKEMLTGCFGYAPVAIAVCGPAKSKLCPIRYPAANGATRGANCAAKNLHFNGGHGHYQLRRRFLHIVKWRTP